MAYLECVRMFEFKNHVLLVSLVSATGAIPKHFDRHSGFFYRSF